jgi:hypothetical protein
MFTKTMKVRRRSGRRGGEGKGLGQRVLPKHFCAATDRNALFKRISVFPRATTRNALFMHFSVLWIPHAAAVVLVTLL